MQDSSELTPEIISNFFNEMNPAEKAGNALNMARFYISSQDFGAAKTCLTNMLDTKPNEVAVKLFVICENGLKSKAKIEEKSKEKSEEKEEENQKKKNNKENADFDPFDGDATLNDTSVVHQYGDNNEHSESNVERNNADGRIVDGGDRENDGNSLNESIVQNDDDNIHKSTGRKRRQTVAAKKVVQHADGKTKKKKNKKSPDEHTPFLMKSKKKKFSCGDCDMSTNDVYNLRRHIRRQHGFFSESHGYKVVERLVCPCGDVIHNGFNFKTHCQRKHSSQKMKAEIDFFRVD